MIAPVPERIVCRSAEDRQVVIGQNSEETRAGRNLEVGHQLVQEPAQFRLQSSAVLDEPLAVIGEELQVAIRSGEMSRGEVVFPQGDTSDGLSIDRVGLARFTG